MLAVMSIGCKVKEPKQTMIKGKSYPSIEDIYRDRSIIIIPKNY